MTTFECDKNHFYNCFILTKKYVYYYKIYFNMGNFKHLTDLEIQQMTFDWRYRGFTTLELLTEE